MDTKEMHSGVRKETKESPMSANLTCCFPQVGAAYILLWILADVFFALTIL